MSNIFHITSVHQRYDTRIFKKECVSLAQAGHSVTLIVCDGLGNEVKEGVTIIDIGVSNKMERLKRFRILPNKIYQYLMTQKDKIDFVHFHDPELIFIGTKLVKNGTKVIYDVHEHVPNQILSKPYLPKFSRKLISWIVNKIEMKLSRCFFAIISVTDELVNRFLKINKNVFLLRNFPVLSSFPEPDFSQKTGCFLYAGGVTRIRGALEMSQAISLNKIPLDIYGPVDNYIGNQLNDNQFCHVYGTVEQSILIEKYKKASVGLCVLHKVPNYLDSYPIKLFEYMASGLAVIISDIPMWKEIVESCKCGICVNPYNIDEIANAMVYMKEHPEEIKQMGMNGRKAVIEKYSWESEEPTLLSIYK